MKSGRYWIVTGWSCRRQRTTGVKLALEGGLSNTGSGISVACSGNREGGTRGQFVCGAAELKQPVIPCQTPTRLLEEGQMGKVTVHPKPCPFCGAIPGIEPWHGAGPQKKMVWCRNLSCHVGPMVTGRTRTVAVRYWNKRWEG